jgi:hypothetical protein
MARFTKQKTINIYNDETGVCYTIEEQTDPGLISIRLTDVGQKEKSITDLTPEAIIEIADAMVEIAHSIQNRDRKNYVQPKAFGIGGGGILVNGGK